MTDTKKTAQQINNTGNPLLDPGRKIFIRTVTHYYVGEIECAQLAPGGDGGWVVMKNCSWVADTGHFGKAMEEGKFSEVEAYPTDTLVSVNLGAVVDISDWEDHDLTELKRDSK
jgi:hypothetical protein